MYSTVHYHQKLRAQFKEHFFSALSGAPAAAGEVPLGEGANQPDDEHPRPQLSAGAPSRQGKGPSI